MNSMLVLLVTLIVLVVGRYLTAPLLTLFHELGHAIAFLIFTDSKKIDVHIGSHGDTAGKFNFKVGRLYFHVTIVDSLTSGGICLSEKVPNSYVKAILIILAGPVFTVILSTILGILVFNSELHRAIKFYFFFLMICAFLGLWHNLVPRVFKKYNLYNDGMQILFRYRIRQLYSDYVLAEEYLLEGKLEEAIAQLMPILSKFPVEEIPLRQLISALTSVNRFDEAKAHLIHLGSFTEYMIEDYVHMGYFQTLSDDYEEAEASFREAYQLNPNHPVVLSNLGYILILSENYGPAEQYLEKAIKLSPLFGEPYNNLGQLKILTNQLEEGRALIEKSISLNPENPHAYKNLGNYYSKTGDMDLARLNFDKASALDPSEQMHMEVKEGYA